MALNNIKRLEKLERCESLTKVDLTMNFINKEALPSLACLQENPHLREMHLLGNPCTEWQGYRPYVIAMLPRLQRLVLFYAASGNISHQSRFRTEQTSLSAKDWSLSSPFPCGKINWRIPFLRRVALNKRTTWKEAMSRRQALMTKTEI